MLNQPPADGRGLIRLRLDLAYDGTMFAGWAKQSNLRTVQSELERVLGIALHQSQPVPVIVGGRTDAGVHARGQVVHFDLPEEQTAELNKLTYSLNGLLPADIRVHQIRQVPAEFDARWSALARRYTYSFVDGPADPLTRYFQLPQWRKLNVEAMQLASRPLLGLHDFTSYCKAEPNRTAIRTLQIFDWHRSDSVVVATLQADAFCHSMVRSLVGAVVQVGQGRRSVDFPAEVLARRQRQADIETLPALGLALETVLYPPDSELAARAAETKARREQGELTDSPTACG